MYIVELDDFLSCYPHIQLVVSELETILGVLYI